MSRIPNQPKIIKGNVPPSTRVALNDMWQKLSQTLNGQISLGGPNGNLGNTDSTHVVITIPNANTNFTFTHGLGRIPVGFIVSSKSAAGDVWKGTIAWTTSQMTVQTNTAGLEAQLLVY